MAGGRRAGTERRQTEGARVERRRSRGEGSCPVWPGRAAAAAGNEAEGKGIARYYHR